MKDKKSVFWAGVFFFIGIALFLIMFFALTDFRTGSKGYSIFVRFKFVAGLNVGAPVRLAGMEVGEVRELKLDKGYVLAKLWLQKEAKIPKSAQITVNTLGLIGERYVEINVSDPKPPFVKPGEEIRGIDPVATAKIYMQGAALMDSVRESINRINDLLNRKDLQSNLSSSLQEISKFLDNLNALLSRSSADLRSSNKNLAVTMRNLKTLTEKLQKSLPPTIEQMNATFKDMDYLVNNIKDTLPLVINSLYDASERLKSILQRVDTGQGSMGKFINESEMYDNLNEFSRKINEKPWLLLKKK